MVGENGKKDDSRQQVESGEVGVVPAVEDAHIGKEGTMPKIEGIRYLSDVDERTGSKKISRKLACGSTPEDQRCTQNGKDGLVSGKVVFVVDESIGSHDQEKPDDRSQSRREPRKRGSETADMQQGEDGSRAEFPRACREQVERGAGMIQGCEEAEGEAEDGSDPEHGESVLSSKLQDRDEEERIKEIILLLDGERPGVQ